MAESMKFKKIEIQDSNATSFNRISDSVSTQITILTDFVICRSIERFYFCDITCGAGEENLMSVKLKDVCCDVLLPLIGSSLFVFIRAAINAQRRAAFIVFPSSVVSLNWNRIR
jgi:hypothetical protein